MLAPTSTTTAASCCTDGPRSCGDVEGPQPVAERHEPQVGEETGVGGLVPQPGHLLVLGVEVGGAGMREHRRADRCEGEDRIGDQQAGMALPALGLVYLHVMEGQGPADHPRELLVDVVPESTLGSKTYSK